MKAVKNQLRKIIREEISKLYKKNLINEHDFDDFTERSSYIDSQGTLIGQHSDNQIAAAKLAYDELKEAGVSVGENRWHNSDPTVLFIIDAEEDTEGKWVSPYYGTERSKMENWKHPKISNFVYDTLQKYRLWPEWADNATIEIRALDSNYDN